MEIRRVTYSDIPNDIIQDGKKCRLLFSNKDNAVYFGGFVGGTFVSLICLVANKNKTGSIKSNYTVREHRGKGYFSELNNYCLDYARGLGLKRIFLNCLSDSKNIHQRAGAKIWRTTKTLFWMYYEL